MKNSPFYLVPCAVLLYVCTAISSATELADKSSRPVAIGIELENDSLKLETHEAPLHEVMRGIGQLAGFKTILVGKFTKPSLVSVSFENIPLHEAIDLLVRDRDRIILYEDSADDPHQRIISQVWLLQSVDGPSDGDVSNVEGIALGLEGDVKGYKLARLTRMLQQDQNRVVRARAATALGTFRDERAVFALESALTDEDSRVRSQAIKALGQIGNEQATIALGNILLQPNADRSEQIMASHALWASDSELAQDYLRAGANDTDTHIRSASMIQPPGSNKLTH